MLLQEEHFNCLPAPSLPTLPIHASQGKLFGARAYSARVSALGRYYRETVAQRVKGPDTVHIRAFHVAIRLSSLLPITSQGSL